MQRATVLLSLLQELRARGSWCGETHIQKSTYFLQELLRVPLDFEFVLYKHGPYSFDLHDEITALRADLLLSIESRSPYGATIVPGEASQSLLERFPVTRKRYSGPVSFVADKLGNRNVADLEKLATALFVTRGTSQRSSADARADRIHDLKPHVSVAAARDAIQQVDAMMEEASAVVVE